VAMTLNSLATVYEAEGKYAFAEGLHKRALTIPERALKGLPDTFNNRATWTADHLPPRAANARAGPPMRYRQVSSEAESLVSIRSIFFDSSAIAGCMRGSTSSHSALTY
jgi:hypothetical protein